VQDYSAGPVTKPAQICKYTHTYMKHSYTKRKKVRYVRVLTQHWVWIFSGSSALKLFITHKTSKLIQTLVQWKGKGRERKKEENEVSLGTDWTVMETFNVKPVLKQWLVL